MYEETPWLVVLKPTSLLAIKHPDFAAGRIDVGGRIHPWMLCRDFQSTFHFATLVRKNGSCLVVPVDDVAYCLRMPDPPEERKLPFGFSPDAGG